MNLLFECLRKSEGTRLRKQFYWYAVRLPAWTACVFLLSGCLYTTHHFNTGRLLEPGQSSLTLGAGPFHSLDYGCPEASGAYNYGTYEITDSTGTHCMGSTQFIDSIGNMNYRSDSVPHVHAWNSTLKGSLGYRLGVHGPFGPFAGAEIGLHLEGPTNPASAEFDLKLGLPLPKGIPFHHSLSGGLGIGAWADNSYFGEYALSRAFGANDLFVNYRATYLASQLSDLDKSESRRHFQTRRRLIHQASLGFLWTLPDIPVLPDFLVPLVVLTYPLAPVGTDTPPPDYLLDDRVWDFSIGMGWTFK
jgi:hypothetical protein